MRSCYQVRKYSWVSIQKCEAEIPVKKGSTSPSIKCTQFPIFTWTRTVHKAKYLSL